jgi:hypothetical protein
VASDPEPEQSIRDFHHEGTIVETHSNCPILADLLEVQRRVGQIGLEEGIARISQLLDLLGQLAIARPEVR